MADRKLTAEMQVFVIQQLAMFERLETVRLQLKEIYDVEVSLPAIIHYQITHINFPEKWRKLFEKTRNDFVNNTNSIPIANKAYRLRELQKLYDKEEQKKLQNTVSMRTTLEQAAKESGDVFTNKQVVDLKNVAELPDEDLLTIVNSKG